MAKAICIIGESGAGKTTSLRNLNPQETYFIDADKKCSAWRGFRQQYNSENRNYIKKNLYIFVFYFSDVYKNKKLPCFKQRSFKV